MVHEVNFFLVYQALYTFVNGFFFTPEIEWQLMVVTED